jgi:hypothetical protein
MNFLSFKRDPDGRLRVIIATIIRGVGYQQTVAGRQRRSRKAREELIKPGGIGRP